VQLSLQRAPVHAERPGGGRNVPAVFRQDPRDVAPDELVEGERPLIKALRGKLARLQRLAVWTCHFTLAVRQIVAWIGGALFRPAPARELTYIKLFSGSAALRKPSGVE
jgi:hypothetical protein